MQYLITLIGGWLVSKLGRTLAIVTINGVVLVAFVAIFGFFISLVIDFYNAVSNFIVLLSTGSSDTVVSKIFGFLNCIGFTDAFYGALPLITSSLVALFSSIFYTLSLRFYKYFRPLIADVVK